jgi:VWFA-related protein
LNEISFSNYKKFEVESSLVASGQVSHPAPPVYEVPEPAATPKVSTVYDQPPPLLDDEKAPRREPETLAEALFPAPQPPPFEEPLSAPSRVTFKERVNVVTVPVVVRDAHGDLVTGLGKDDFELLDNRKPRPITSFAEEQSSGTVSATLERASAFNSNAPASNNAVRPSSPHTPRYVAFIFDDIHLETGNLAEVRSAVQRTLAGLLQPMTRVALVTTSGHIVTGFSADRDQLVTTLNRIQPNPVMKPRSVCPDISFYQADRIVNNEERDALSAATEDAFIQCGIPEDQPDLARATAQSAARQIVAANEYAARAALRFVQTVVDRMAGLPGERSVILVSPGFMARPGSPDTEAIIDRAVRNGIVINALDSRGLAVLPGSSAETGATGTAHSQIVNRRYENDEQNLQSDVLIQLADATGGLTFRNSNDYDAGLNALTEGPRLIYLLGFSPDNDAHPGYHRLKVSVRGRHNLDLQARRGYVIDRRAHNAE